MILQLMIASAAVTTPLKVECLGEKTARRNLVYLHGFEDVGKMSGEEKQNRELLAKLAKDVSLRIALPEGPVCPKNRRCWPAKDTDEVLETFAGIKTAIAECFNGKDYTLVGFSNGGYYAFKIYKAHKDPLLKTVIASSSSGLWDAAVEKVNPLSTFHLMIGDKDMTRGNAEAFMTKFRKADSSATFSVFGGGHRMDYKTLKNLLISTEK